MEEFFKKQLSKKKDDANINVVDQLYQKPKKDKVDDQVHFPYPNTGFWQQCDLLTLPNDKGYDLALVLVDVGSRKVDAEPLTNKTGVNILKALNTIWKRKILTVPKQLTSDMGTEFSNKDVQTGLKKLNVGFNTALQGRHRQVALVERKNQTIGKLIHKFIVYNETAAGNASSQWVEALPTIVKVINEKVDDVIQKQKEKADNWPKDKDYKITMLNVGQKVRVQLDNPQSIQGGHLHGKFRAGDIRFNPVIRTIKYVLLKPNQPPMYLLDGNYGPLKVEKAGYSQNQLQLVKDNESIPEKPLVNVENNRFEFEKIIGKKVENKKIFYLVKWKGQPKKDSTYEPRDELIKDVPQKVKAYEKLK